MQFDFLPYLLITATIWATYSYALKCGFVSDDLQGILNYDGKLQGYEYGMISRWLRYHICGGNFPSKHVIKNPDGKDFVIPQGKVPLHHHVLMISVFNAAALLTYHFLRNAIGTKLAFLSIVLLCVHPVGVQAIAWCSGLGYPLSLFWIAAMLNLMQWYYAGPTPVKSVFTTIVFVLFQFLGIHAQFIPMMTCVILWFLGYKLFAVLGALISVVMCFDIIRQTVAFRKDEFKKQLMGASTSFNIRKFNVAMKTFLYYLGLAVVPKKMGLYHKWGFHYSQDLERADRHTLMGVMALVALGGIFWLSPSVPVKLGILWFVSFSIIFWNWVTIQQFVTERYIFIPTLGLCMIISFYTQNHLWIYTFILGLYLCRTWMHLPTYESEIRFYQSNNWNFPDSEVALGNLGVAYINVGLEGMALDTWTMATKINSDYDVPWYNIFSTLRTRANMLLQHGDYLGCIKQLEGAYPHLQKTLACKVCHFPEMWKKESEDLLNTLKNPFGMLRGELARLEKLGGDLLERQRNAKSPEELQGIYISIQNNDSQLARLQDFLQKNEPKPAA